jgi:cysteine sulfinate desulfinase/cysteine desulfurase-like protein
MAAAAAGVRGAQGGRLPALTAQRDADRGLSSIPHSVLNGDAKAAAGNVNFSFEGVEGEALLLLLTKKESRIGRQRLLRGSSPPACAAALAGRRNSPGALR